MTTKEFVDRIDEIFEDIEILKISHTEKFRIHKKLLSLLAYPASKGEITIEEG